MKTIIKEIYKNTDKYLGQDIKIEAWVRTIRSSNVFGFIELNDGTFAVIAKYSVTAFPSGTSRQAVYFPVSPQTICDQYQTGANATCAGLISTASVDVNAAQKFIVYFFISYNRIYFALGKIRNILINLHHFLMKRSSFCCRQG